MDGVIKAIGILGMMTAVAQPAVGADLQPLMQMLGTSPAKLTAPQEATFAARCAALYMAFANRLRGSASAAEVSLVAKADAAALNATRIALQIDPHVDANELAGMAVIYSADMESNWAHQGNVLIGYVKDDLSLCGYLGSSR